MAKRCSTSSHSHAHGLWGGASVNLLTSREEFRSLRGRFGLFDMAIQWCAGPRNVHIFSHEVSKFTLWYRNMVFSSRSLSGRPRRVSVARIAPARRILDWQLPMRHHLALPGMEAI